MDHVGTWASKRNYQNLTYSWRSFTLTLIGTQKKKKRDLSITTDMPIAGLAQCTAAVNVKNH